MPIRHWFSFQWAISFNNSCITRPSAFKNPFPHWQVTSFNVSAVVELASNPQIVLNRLLLGTRNKRKIDCEFKIQLLILYDIKPTSWKQAGLKFLIWPWEGVLILTPKKPQLISTPDWLICRFSLKKSEWWWKLMKAPESLKYCYSSDEY